MSANTETTGADRTKCAEWCGKEYGARGVPFRRSCGFPMYFEHGAAFNVAVKDNEPAWCSIACRDARLPPIATPSHPVESWSPGQCPSCLTLDSSTCTPPEGRCKYTNAAPAAHVERRKGQRYIGSITGRVATVVEKTKGNDRWLCSFSDGGLDAPVALGNGSWTLLADAPPEPAKPTVTSYGGGTLCSCHSCGYAQAVGTPCNCPPSQEAPKAAPMLEWSFTDKEGRDHWFATGGERDTASRAYGAWMKAQTGKPYSGPERSPRPQLAADWVEDCLEDA